MKDAICGVIGSGPAGLAAAMSLARANIKTIVFSGDKFGGQIIDAEKINNCPGFKQNISGKKMIDMLYKQAYGYGADMVYKTVTKVNFNTNPFIVSTSDGDEKFFDVVIISTGKKANRLVMAEKFVGRGVSYCAVCDGQFFKNKDVCVVGGGDSALKAALFLSNLVKYVHIFVRRDVMRASLANQRLVLEQKNILIHKNTEIIHVNGEHCVTGVEILEDNIKKSMRIDGIFVMAGAVPATDVFEDYLNLDSEGYIVTDDKCRTNIDGVFAAGDVQSSTYKQVPIAIGNATTAALSALTFLQNNK